MDSLGVAHFYYGRTVPDHAVAIAQISAKPYLASDLATVNSTAYLPGDYTVTPKPTGAAFDAKSIGNSIAITGSLQYLLNNQFFELTNQVDSYGNPLYYQHALPSDQVTNVSITDPSGNVITDGYRIQGSAIYHSFDGSPFLVSYYYFDVYVTKLLQYAPILTQDTVAGPSSYVFNVGGLITVSDAGAHLWIRFTGANGYTVLPPYDTHPNDPWYPRIRFNLRPLPPEWGLQPFQPQAPYLLASWVPGKVLSSNLIEFARPNIWFDSIDRQYPDVLVYDANYNLKYALEGLPPNLQRPLDKGYLFPWRSSQLVDIDPRNGRVQTQVTLDPTDLVFGFYAYREMDFVYRSLDVNPYSNPAVKECVIQFYYKPQATVDPTHVVYHEIRDIHNTLVSTNDPSPDTGVKQYFGSLVVGFAVGLDQITTADVRQPGGGLLPDYQSLPVADNFWDLGYLDGRPYPTVGAMVLQLPLSLLLTLTASQIQAQVDSIIPTGTRAIIRYYDPITGDDYPAESIPPTYTQTVSLQAATAVAAELQQVLYQDALPVSGAYNAGDCIYKLHPVAGGNEGWICITGGIPGVWQPFGVIGDTSVNTPLLMATAKAGLRMLYGDSIPTSGLASQGDRIYMLHPIAGGNIGWVCVSGGDPGTWQPFGMIGE